MAESKIGQNELVAAKKGIIHVTHNNDRVHYWITIDDAKEGDQLWDLTPYFKARVGDSAARLDVCWSHQGGIRNLDNSKPIIGGNSGDYFIDSNHQIQLEPGAATVHWEGSTEDIGGNGYASYYFPPEMFPKSGIFKGYIGIKDEKGSVSGVDIWFKVLPGLARMGHAKEVYVSEIEDMKLQFAAQQRAAINDAKQKLDDTVQSMNADYQKALDEHNKNFDAEMADIKSKLDEANQLAQSILDSDKLLDKALDANTEAIQNKMAPVLNQSNVFVAQNTFQQGALMQNGLTVNGVLLVNGVDLSKLADQVNTLQVDVDKITGGK